MKTIIQLTKEEALDISKKLATKYEGTFKIRLDVNTEIEVRN